MRKFIRNIFILLILGLIGCSTPKYLPSTNYNIIKKDSLVIKTELVSVAVPLESHNIITTKKSHLETSVAVSDASIDSLGMLHHSLENKKDSIITVIKYVDKIQIRDTTIVKEIPVEVEKYVNKHYWYESILWFLSVLFILTIIFKILKRKLGF